jgi:hypothetical protein
MNNPDFKFQPIVKQLKNSGIQEIYKFDNNFGASVIMNPNSYGGDEGLWELAVLEFEDSSERSFITYDTEITDDVLGYLTEKQVEEILQTISEINKETKMNNKTNNPDFTQQDLQFLKTVMQEILLVCDCEKKYYSQEIQKYWELSDKETPRGRAAFEELNYMKDQKRKLKEKTSKLAEIQYKIKKQMRG